MPAMDLVNTTRLPAAVFRTCTANIDNMEAVFVVRVTYDWAMDAKEPTLTVAEEQKHPVHAGPLETPYGNLMGDMAIATGGTDVMVHAICRPGAKIDRAQVSVEAGSADRPALRSGIMVFGTRRWKKEGKSFSITKPEAFDEMPLDLTHAFGGKDTWDLLEVAHPGNPIGKGYNHTDENTDGRELPNVEDPKALIEKWTDQPDPAGIGPAPLLYPGRTKGNLKHRPDGTITHISPRIYNSAFADLIYPGWMEPGQRVTVTGVRPKTLGVVLPKERPIARVEFNDKRTEEAMDISQVLLDVEARQVIMTYRWPFRYKFIPTQKRLAAVLWPEGKHAGVPPKLTEEIMAEKQFEAIQAKRQAQQQEQAPALATTAKVGG
jgi:hypothetical protein